MWSYFGDRLYKPYLYAFGQYIVEVSNFIPMLMAFWYTAPMDAGAEGNGGGAELNLNASTSTSYALCMRQDNATKLTDDVLDPNGNNPVVC